MLIWVDDESTEQSKPVIKCDGIGLWCECASCTAAWEIIMGGDDE